MIPLIHDLSDATVLVFGGGRVGGRKARRFAREASVVVVSPTFADASFGGAKRVRAAPGADDVAGWIDRVSPALVVAATDDQAINAAIEAAAARAGVLVNRADRPGSRPANSVIVPATARIGPVSVAVTSEGTDPAVSRAARDRAAAALSGAAAVAAATSELRDRLVEAGLAKADRLAAVRAVAGSNAVWAAAQATDRDTMAAAIDVVAGLDIEVLGPHRGRSGVDPKLPPGRGR